MNCMLRESGATRPTDVSAACSQFIQCTGVLKLQQLVGKRIAMEWALTGDFFSAQRAYEVGFVNRITDGAALDAAMELAATVAANGPLSADAPRVDEAENLSTLINLAIDDDHPIVVQVDGRDAGVITRADLLRTVIEGTEVS